jgi:hypothetical protein
LIITQIGASAIYSDDELRFMYENGQGHLTLFCIVFVWLRGRPSTVRSPIQDPWFMYQNRLGPSGGIYYPNFVPCFVYHQLNVVGKTKSWEKYRGLRYLSRFFDCLVHLNQSATLATDPKWPSICLCISYIPMFSRVPLTTIINSIIKVWTFW